MPTTAKARRPRSVASPREDRDSHCEDDEARDREVPYRVARVLHGGVNVVGNPHHTVHVVEHLLRMSSLRAATWCAAFASAVDVEVIATAVLTPELELPSQLEGHTTTAWIHGRLGVDWTSALRDAGVRTDTRVVHEADPVAGLTDTAEHVAADVVVVGLHARALLVERRVNETASRLLHRTPVSLVLVP
jgi:hypothetical protein